MLDGMDKIFKEHNEKGSNGKSREKNDSAVHELVFPFDKLGTDENTHTNLVGEYELPANVYHKMYSKKTKKKPLSKRPHKQVESSEDPIVNPPPNPALEVDSES